VVRTRITQKGQIEVLNTGESVFLGFEVGRVDDLSSNKNVGVGHQALRSNTSGFNNVAVGYGAGYFNKEGRSNTMIGYQAGYSTTTGLANTFIGESTGYTNTIGRYNTILGSGSGYKLLSGYRNIFIGVSSGFNIVSGDDNIFIGYQSGFNETGSNKLYIENSNSTTPLIYGDFANDTVRVNGTLNVVGNIKLSGEIIQENKTAVTYVAPWADYPAPYEGVTYYKNKEGRVHLQGLARYTGAAVTGTMFTLPSGYRPAARLILTGRQHDKTVRIDIDPSGSGELMTTDGGYDFVSLS
jgi:hypothetical protein